MPRSRDELETIRTLIEWSLAAARRKKLSAAKIYKLVLWLERIEMELAIATEVEFDTLVNQEVPNEG